MFDKVNMKNVINSFYLGLFIGLCVQVYVGREASAFSFSLSLLMSGVIGFIIGLVTEGFTALLPIRLANTKMYFLINNAIAVLVASLILIVFKSVIGGSLPSEQYFKMLVVVLSIVILANLMEYISYRVSNKKLERFKKEHKNN